MVLKVVLSKFSNLLMVKQKEDFMFLARVSGCVIVP